MLAMRRCVARPATTDEVDDLLALLEESRQWYSQNPEDAQKLAGNQQRDGVPVEEVAAWVTTTRVILNQDEFITRE